MNTRFDRDCIDVLHSKSAADFPEKIVAFSHDRGFGLVSATVLTEHSPTLKKYRYITTAPNSYMPRVRGSGRRSRRSRVTACGARVDAAHVESVYLRGCRAVPFTRSSSKDNQP